MKQFLLKQMMRAQLKKMPPEQRELVERLVDENPELLMKLAQEVQEEMQQGKDQMAALAAVSERHKDALQRLRDSAQK